MHPAFTRLARRRQHLDQDNPLRSLTEVINAVPRGINLGQGVCDLDTPAPLRAGAIASIDGGDRQTYTHYSGLPELRAQIRSKLASFNGIRVADDEILVAAGSSGAFLAAALTLFDPGDECILFEPFYSYHYSQLRLLDVVPVCVPLAPPDYAFDQGRVRKALSARTRAVMVNTPANPSGKVFAREDLEALGAVLAGTPVVVLTDEVYEYMCFDGRRHLSPAAVPALAERTLTISSFSKTFSITGWRVGYLAGPRAIVEAAGRVFDQTNVCAARPMQRGVERALRELPSSFYAELQTGYEKKRDQLCEALAAAGFGVHRPQGAYYVMAEYRDVFGDIDPYRAVRTMIERIGINAVPGHVFHARPDGVRTMRFQFAVTPAVLDEVCARLRALR